MVSKTYTTVGPDHTKDIAKNLAGKLKGGELITLTGDLGAGKTTFTQGLAKSLGVTRVVNSPTFIIHRSYKVSHPTIKEFHHIDLYRIESAADLDSLGLEEIFNQKDAVVVIEWPEKMEHLLPTDRIGITLEYISDNKRIIRID